MMVKYSLAYYGGDPDLLNNEKQNPLFTEIVLDWSKPQQINSSNPIFGDERSIIYIIMRDHHAMNEKNRISYIGLSTNPKRRFYNHPTARNLSEKRGKTTLSYATVDKSFLHKGVSEKQALEEIEHILIYVHWQHLDNKDKCYRLPGVGKTSSAWRIINKGFRFSGKMPAEIVYPWMIVRNGRDRSAK